jgi:CheY-like chemotaxis protein
VEQNLAMFNNERTTYRLILMDINMPFMDGYQCSKKIVQLMQDNQVEAPMICAVTGHTEPEFVDMCFHCGMNKVFNKPIKIDELRETLQELNYLK